MSCTKDHCERERTYTKRVPVYKTTDEIRVGIENQTPRELENPGKIYFYNNYIFINEIREGIHIIDNTDPANPTNIGFMAITGNLDMAIHNNMLYADNFIDLLTIDISDVQNIQLVDRDEGVLPFFQFSDQGYLMYFEEVEVTEIVDCDASPGFESVFYDDDIAFVESTGADQSNAPSSGIGGSLARFTLCDDILYIVESNSLNVFDVAAANNPVKGETIDLGWGIETVIPFGDYLFIGSQTGMLIYDKVDPRNPQYVSDFSHAQACDPVYVKDNYAYVTLRDGTECQNFINELDLIDISDITNPTLVEVFQMDNPHGLSIKENSLFLCEGDFGFKTFDISDPKTLDTRMESHLQGLNAYDVIALSGNQDVVLIIGDDGFFQYDVSDKTAPQLISSILVEK